MLELDGIAACRFLEKIQGPQTLVDRSQKLQLHLVYQTRPKESHEGSIRMLTHSAIAHIQRDTFQSI